MGYEGCSIQYLKKTNRTKEKKGEVDKEWLKLSSAKLS